MPPPRAELLGITEGPANVVLLADVSRLDREMRDAAHARDVERVNDQCRANLTSLGKWQERYLRRTHNWKPHSFG